VRHSGATRGGERRHVVLLGRGPECAALDRLLGAVRGGRSGALVVHGEPGASGVEAEVELR